MLHRRVAVLIPCLNESATIAKVIAESRAFEPDASIWVVDNGSTDGTAEIARAAGAEVIVEGRRGKGRAIRTALARIDAEVFVLIDGDDQMALDRLPALVAPILAGEADMVVGSRSLGTDDESHLVNRIGNWGFSLLIRTLLGVRLTDVLSGFRAMSATAARSLPLAADGFEIEVELTIKAAQQRFRVIEVPVSARARALGDRPRLRVVRDGLRILAAITVLLLRGHPLRFFAAVGVALLAAAGSTLLYGLGWSTTKGPLSSGFDVIVVLVGGILGLAGLASIAAGLLLTPVARRLRSDQGGSESQRGSAQRP